MTYLLCKNMKKSENGITGDEKQTVNGRPVAPAAGALAGADRLCPDADRGRGVRLLRGDGGGDRFGTPVGVSRGDTQRGGSGAAGTIGGHRGAASGRTLDCLPEEGGIAVLCSCIPAAPRDGDSGVGAVLKRQDPDQENLIGVCI